MSGGDRGPARQRSWYARMLRLRYVQPGGLLSFLLFECVIAGAALLALAELVSWWAVAALPLAVAAMVKLNDLVSGAMSRNAAQLESPRGWDVLPASDAPAVRSARHAPPPMAPPPMAPPPVAPPPVAAPVAQRQAPAGGSGVYGSSAARGGTPGLYGTRVATPETAPAENRHEFAVASERAVHQPDRSRVEQRLDQAAHRAGLAQGASATRTAGGYESGARDAAVQSAGVQSAGVQNTAARSGGVQNSGIYGSGIYGQPPAFEPEARPTQPPAFAPPAPPPPAFAPPGQQVGARHGTGAGQRTPRHGADFGQPSGARHGAVGRSPAESRSAVGVGGGGRSATRTAPALDPAARAQRDAESAAGRPEWHQTVKLGRHAAARDDNSAARGRHDDGSGGYEAEQFRHRAGGAGNQGRFA